MYCMLSFTDTSVIHLVDGPSKRPNIGRVQVQYDDLLTDVCFEGNREDGGDKLWNLLSLKILCQNLEYPGALMTSNITVSNNLTVTNVFTDDYKCGGKMLLHSTYVCKVFM